MCSQNTYLIINSIGLISDIIGAIFVSSEVVKQFSGKKFNKVDVGKAHFSGGDDLIEESPEFQSSEKSKYTRMKIGLGLLIFGFILQIISNVLQVRFH